MIVAAFGCFIASVFAEPLFVETIYRNIWLMVLYDSRNFVQVNLGSQKVTVGSASTDTIFVSDTAPKSATFLVIGDNVQYTDSHGTQLLTPGNRIKMNNAELIICSNEVPFAPSKFYPMKMSRAIELMKMAK